MYPRRCLTTTITAACLLFWAGGTSAARGNKAPNTDAVLDWNAIMVATLHGAARPYIHCSIASLLRVCSLIGLY